MNFTTALPWLSCLSLLSWGLDGREAQTGMATNTLGSWELEATEEFLQWCHLCYICFRMYQYYESLHRLLFRYFFKFRVRSSCMKNNVLLILVELLLDTGLSLSVKILVNVRLLGAWQPLPASGSVWLSWGDIVPYSIRTFYNLRIWFKNLLVRHSHDHP